MSPNTTDTTIYTATTDTATDSGRQPRSGRSRFSFKLRQLSPLDALLQRLNRGGKKRTGAFGKRRKTNGQVPRKDWRVCANSVLDAAGSARRAAEAKAGH